MEDPDIDGIELDMLQDYIENGRTGTMPEEVAVYLSQLDIVRGLLDRNQSRAAIVRLLKSPPYNLSDYIARKRYADAINFFYLDNRVKKESWRNMYAEKMEKAAELALRGSRTVKDLDVYKNLMKEAACLRGLYEPDAPELPPALFEKQYKVYTTKPEDVGLPPIDRRQLADQIDTLPINETHKARIRRDAAIDQPQIFSHDPEEKN